MDNNDWIETTTELSKLASSSWSLVSPGFHFFWQIVSTLIIRSAFFTRNAITNITRIICLPLLLVLDFTILCCYTSSNVVDYFASSDQVRVHSQSDTLDIHVLRKLFWSGADVAVGPTFRTLKLPAEIFVRTQPRPDLDRKSSNWASSIRQTRTRRHDTKNTVPFQTIIQYIPFQSIVRVVLYLGKVVLRVTQIKPPDDLSEHEQISAS